MNLPKSLNNDASQPLPWHVAIVLADKHSASFSRSSIFLSHGNRQSHRLLNRCLTVLKLATNSQPTHPIQMWSLLLAATRTMNLYTKPARTKMAIRFASAAALLFPPIDAAAPAIPPADDVQLPLSSPWTRLTLAKLQTFVVISCYFSLSLNSL